MIIKSSTALCNDYSMISDLANEKAEQREETLKLRAKQRELEAIAQLYINLVGPNSARNI